MHSKRSKKDAALQLKDIATDTISTYHGREGRFILLLHRENVCPNAEDAVQEEHARRVLLEVGSAVLVAKLQVVQE